MPRNVVVMLTLEMIGAILERVEADASSASDMVPSTESPLPKRKSPPLPPTVIAALKRKKRTRPLIDGKGYHVALQPDDAATLSSWCRSRPDQGHARILRAAAAAIEREMDRFP